ncbi:unnamed protein product [Amoebophrya sp. A120]|nr:unnamed protein product [Amoebophrya sp. A120]|eukprot:GSA120T00018511001.1
MEKFSWLRESSPWIASWFTSFASQARGWMRRFWQREMYIMSRCEKWADRVNIRAILAVEEGDLEQIRNAVKAAARLVSDSRKPSSIKPGKTSKSTAVPSARAASEDHDSSPAHDENQKFSTESEWRDELSQQESEPLKLVVMTLAEADKDLNLFANRGAKEWISADLLSSWYSRHAVDFSASEN